MDVRDSRLRELAFAGNFGLERESLRIAVDGRFAATPHPFPDSPRIVRDFCENQTEINTGAHPSAAGAVAELIGVNDRMLVALRGAAAPELLWPFSSPPRIFSDDDIVPARFDGNLAGKSAYREYLSVKYGRRLMTFCGVHVNFSFGDALLSAAAVVAGADVRAYRDRLYLSVAERMLEWAWAVVPLTAASPLLDASFMRKGAVGDDFAGMASVRCSELGYWNHFTPVLDFGGVRNYATSIMRYVDEGVLAAPSELYYPVRLKPRGPNRLVSLVDGGVDHLELRCVDLNPFADGLVDVRDVEFVHLLALWCAHLPPARLSARDQVQAVRNFKNAARYDLDGVDILLPDGRHGTVRRTGLALMDALDGFFAGFHGRPQEVLAFERAKLEDPETRYAARVLREFGGGFTRRGLELAESISTRVAGAAGAGTGRKGESEDV